MPARRSQDLSLTPAERAGEGALEHWDEERRRRADPVPLERPLPNRDHRPEGLPPDDVGAEDGAPQTCIDDQRADGAARGESSTDQ
ncbi:hypothetical protein [Brachybacterium sp.]|uniref:hypothetical protein n=1 Tax=Brachybacterium sp. TaxID=1891286 RepID=UPI002ED3B233